MSDELPAPGGLPDDDLERELTLVELVNRVLDRGVVLRGDVVISVADIDLVYLGLHLVLTSTEQLHRRLGSGDQGAGPDGA